MKIGVQTGGIVPHVDLDGAYRIIKEAGFDGVDAGISSLQPGNSVWKKEIVRAFTDWTLLKDAVQPWKDGAKKYGLENFQAHTVFPGALPGEEGAYNDYLMNVVHQCIRACDYIDCRRLIIHPFFFPYDTWMKPEEERTYNIERYSQLIPTAKQYGVTICLENMFTVHNGRIYGACCSDIGDACCYVDELNRIAGERLFGFCLDTGHLTLCGLDIKNAMVRLGERIEAFHVHDNDGRNDQHLAPFMGVLDWQRFVEGLRDIKYDKPMCFETYNIWNVFDPEIAPDAMALIAKTGRMFARRAAE